MSTRNLVNSNMWQIVSADTNNLPAKVYNQYIPLPTATQIGGVRPDLKTIFIDGAGVISASGGGSGNYYFVPFIFFNSGPNGGTGLTFIDTNLLYYSDNASLMTVTVNGVSLSPNNDYSVLDSVLTFNIFLSANSEIEIAAKAVPYTQSGGSNVTTQDGNLLTTQAGDFLILN